MEDASETAPEHEEEWSDWTRAAAKFGMKHDRSKAARKKRQKKMIDSVDERNLGDGRSLRATGRTELYNFRAKPEILELLKAHVPKGKTSLWLEEAIIAKLKEEGVEVKAAPGWRRYGTREPSDALRARPSISAAPGWRR